MERLTPGIDATDAVRKLTTSYELMSGRRLAETPEF